MGKKLIIPNADFSQNAIEIAMFETVNPNTDFQIMDNGSAVNVRSDANSIYEHEDYITFAGGQNVNLFNGPATGTTTDIKKALNLRLNISSLTSYFRSCINIEEISIKDIKTDSTSIGFSYTFNNCRNLKEIEFPKNKQFLLKSDISYAFQNTGKIKKLDLSMFDTQNVTKISLFFTGFNGVVTELEELNLSGWNLPSLDTSSVSNYQYAFNNCNNLTKVIINNCNASTITKLITILGAYSTKSYTQSTDSEGNTVLIGA